MPPDPVNDAVRMAGCGLAVAAAAVPVGLAGYTLARRNGESVWPRWKPWRVPWGGAETVVAFLVVLSVVPGVVSQVVAASGLYQSIYGPDFPFGPAPQFESQAAVAGVPAAAPIQDALFVLATVRELWVGLLALPVQFALLAVGCRLLYPYWRLPAGPSFSVRVAVAVLAWVVLTPLVLAAHAGVLAAFDALGWTPDEHPLVKLGARPALDRVLFALRACVAAPLVEEVAFRGVLLPWLLGRRRRTWIVLALGVLVAAAQVWRESPAVEVIARGPVLFAGGLVAGLAILAILLRRKRRTVGAVYASAALFAVVHSGVWPSPVPLFVLGLGLGYLAARTRGFLVPAAVHGLFNAVSVLFVLRGPG